MKSCADTCMTRKKTQEESLKSLTSLTASVHFLTFDQQSSPSMRHCISVASRWCTYQVSVNDIDWHWHLNTTKSRDGKRTGNKATVNAEMMDKQWLVTMVFVWWFEKVQTRTLLLKLSMTAWRQCHGSPSSLSIMSESAISMFLWIISFEYSLTNLNMFQFEYKCSLSSTATAYKVNPGWHTMAGTGSGFWQVRDIGFWSFEIYAVDMKSHQVLFSWHEISETWLTMTWLTRPAG